MTSLAIPGEAFAAYGEPSLIFKRWG